MAFNIQFLRNSSIKTSRDEALSVLKAKLTDSTTKIGTPAIAIYTATEDNKTVYKCLFGINTAGGNVQVFDADAIPSEVQTELDDIKSTIETLTGGTGTTSSIDSKISTAINALDSNKTSTDGSHVNVKVTLANGKVTAVNVTESDIASAALLGTASDTSTASTAFGKAAKAQAAADAAQSGVNTLNGTGTGSVAKAVSDAINALDVTDTAVSGKYVSAVSETDGKIKVTRASLPDYSGTYEAKGAANTALTNAKAYTDELANGQVTTNKNAIATLNGTGTGSVSKAVSDAIAGITGTLGTDDAKTLAAINDELDTLSSNLSKNTYKIVSVTPSATNVKEEWKLQVNGADISGSSNIKIYKDSSLKSVALDNQTLNFTYILSDGTESTVGVDVSKFLAESEFGNGLQVVDHIVSVKKDTTSESFLTVGTDGIKLSGVQTAINSAKTSAVSTAGTNADTKISTAINALSGTTTGDGTFVDVAITQSAGKITNVKVTESGIASSSDLDNLEELVGTTGDTSSKATAFGKIKLNAEAIDTLESLVGTTAVATQITNAINGLDVTDTAVSGKYVSAVSETNGKIKVTRASLPDYSDTYEAKGTASGLIAALDATVGSTSVASGKHVAVQVVETDGKLTDVTVTENDIASAALLGTASDASTANTAFGKIAANTANITSVSNLVGTTAVATQITNAIGALDKADSAVTNQFVTAVSETNGVISVTRGAVLSATEGNVLSMNAGGVFYDGSVDCGEY